MSPIELFRTALALVFAAVAVYSVMRLVSSFTTAGSRHPDVAASGIRASDAMHALSGVALAVLVLPLPDVGSPLLGMAGVVVFGAVATRFATAVRHHGVTSCVAAERRGGHGGYHLHHLAGCAAMMYLWAGVHLVSGTGAGTTSFAADSGLGASGTASLTSLNWLFGLYFLVAATSLGFRVAEPAVRITHHVALPAGDATQLPGARVAPVRTTRAGLLTSPAGRCASEVITSGGMALVFFSAL